MSARRRDRSRQNKPEVPQLHLENCSNCTVHVHIASEPVKAKPRDQWGWMKRTAHGLKKVRVGLVAIWIAVWYGK